MIFRRSRSIRKAGKDLCRHAQHFLNMREDILTPRDAQQVRDARKQLSEALRQRDSAGIEAGCNSVSTHLERLTPPRSHEILRENIEVLVVAVAVAMCFRAHFVQPFKIPTGSMQPTLHGIRYTAANLVDDDLGLRHRKPFAMLNWLLTGDLYVEIRAKNNGDVRMDTQKIVVGNRGHKYSLDMDVRVRPGQSVTKGELLASGIRHTGDHLFVNKIRWNFTRPQRGQVMVFTTDNIPALHEKRTHYIKRMVGLPSERISIDPPDLLINGTAVSNTAAISRIQNSSDGYAGYQFARGVNVVLGGPMAYQQLNQDQFFACGDNQFNSADSRFWGPVPRANLVGPAVFVYWPFASHWGLIK